MESDGRGKAYKFVTYSAVTFSVVSILSVCITLPMVYNYVQHIQDSVAQEMQYCKVRPVLAGLDEILNGLAFAGVSQGRDERSEPIPNGHRRPRCAQPNDRQASSWMR